MSSSNLPAFPSSEKPLSTGDTRILSSLDKQTASQQSGRPLDSEQSPTKLTQNNQNSPTPFLPHQPESDEQLYRQFMTWRRAEEIRRVNSGQMANSDTGLATIPSDSEIIAAIQSE